MILAFFFYHSSHYFVITRMTEKYRCWSEESLMLAVTDIREKKISFRKAEVTYGIPKSTLHDYVSGKVEIGCKPGPSSILTVAEEQKLVEYYDAVEMSRIGYGLTRERIMEMVKKILDKDGEQILLWRTVLVGSGGACS